MPLTAWPRCAVAFAGPARRWSLKFADGQQGAAPVGTRAKLPRTQRTSVRAGQSVREAR